MNVSEILWSGLKFAEQDYSAIAGSQVTDVKPKEDQIKCAVYHAFSNQKYLVHVEKGYSRNGGRCDLIAFNKAKTKSIAIEIKTAWAATGWVNKPKDQEKSWRYDIGKLKSLRKNRQVTSGIFVLCFIYEDGCRSEKNFRQKISKLQGIASKPIQIKWGTDLNRLQFIVCTVF